jgi:hypothetical protein
VSRERYARLREEGRCVACRTPLGEARYTRCVACRARALAAVRRYKARAQAAGLCPQCGAQPSWRGQGWCASCRRKYAAQRAARKNAQKNGECRMENGE